MAASTPSLTHEVVLSRSKKLLVAIPSSEREREACLCCSDSWRWAWQELSWKGREKQ